MKEKVLTTEEAEEIAKSVHDHMDSNYKKVHGSEPEEFESDVPLAVSEEAIKAVRNEKPTKVPAEELYRVVNALTNIPEGFALHPKLKKFLDTRKKFIDDDNAPVDWAFGEALAFGSLMTEGVPVRLSGQDSARGTFSQRHLVFTDVNTGEEILPLNSLENSAKMEALDSLLSEAAVLGFEYGYSTADPITLVLWEAQFGDFANAAQVIIDNFIVCSYNKWDLPNNLIMLLPHAQEGQGPEHSSARVERYLELCAKNNMFVCYPTTSAQYFHLLRRRAKAKFPKPLIIMTPKSLLREKLAASVKSDFTDGRFSEIINDGMDKEKANRVILTSGKVYYDLYKHREKNEIKDTAIIRLEQYYPFPGEELKGMLAEYKNAKEVVWVQEEPENMGAWLFLSQRLPGTLAKGQKFRFVAREESPSPAPGSKKLFDKTQAEIISAAFGN